MLKDLHFHDHPSMEKAHKIPIDHVIIDRSAYVEVLELRSKESSKLGCIIEDQVQNYPEPIIRLYPNKFKVIRDKNEVEELGIYYINDKIREDAVEPLSKWIANLCKEKDLIMGGLTRAVIRGSDFGCQYNYPLKGLNSEHTVDEDKMEEYFDLHLNSIRIDGSKGYPRIFLWGNCIRNINQIRFSSITLPRMPLTIGQAAVIMSLIDIVLDEGYQAMWNCLYPLKAMRWIYNGCQVPSQPHIVVIQFNPSVDDCYINLENKDNLQKDLDYLKKYLIKE